MGLSPLRLRGPALKLGSVGLALAICAGLAWMLRSRFSHPKISDQALLREAVAEWKLAGSPGQGPDPQIFEQQAGQGYYEDAAATGRLFKSDGDVQWSVVELAKIRTENGDVQGAEAGIARFRGTGLWERAIRNIANVQAYKGDIPGALVTASEIHDTDDVLTIFADQQIAAGDFEGALETSGRMSLKSAGQLFYDVGDGLRIHHAQNRVRELASRMQDRRYAALFRQIVPFTLWDHLDVRSIPTIQATPCDTAAMYATEGKFALADSTLEQNKCSYVTFVAIQQYSVDPVGAERLLRTATNAMDLASGWNQFTLAAAAKGDLAEAFRFLDNLQKMGRVNPQAVHAVARVWTIKNGPQAVIQWARSRPTLDQRTSALIGMAEALGHARPCQVPTCTR